MGKIDKLIKPDKKLKKDKQDNVIPARCAVTGENFDIAIGYENGRLTMLKGVRAAAVFDPYAHGVQGGLKTLDLSNGLDTSLTYHCPICGNKDIVRCNTCHHITCYDGTGKFQCAYCGNSGTVSGTMQSVEVYDPGGVKKDGIKPKSGLKYYPGDK